MGWKTIVGVILGFTIGFFIYSIWKGEFDWSMWIFQVIGAFIGALIAHFIFTKIRAEQKGK